MSFLRSFPLLITKFNTVKAGIGYQKAFSSSLVNFHLCKHNPQIGFVSLNRPSVKNALSNDVLDQLDVVVDKIWANQKDIRCIIVGSSTPGIFCAGADLKERLTMDNLGVQGASSKIRRIFQKLSSLPVPSIAAVDGAAMGGGTELALACDLRVGTSRCFFALPETGHAIIPGAGGTQRLQRIVGSAIAKDLIFTGRQVKMEEALNIMLLNYTVRLENEKTEKDESLAKAYEIATVISSKGPIAIRAAKRAINMGEQLWMDAALKVEETCYLEIAQTKDRIEGLIAFKEKRKPSYKGE